VPVGSFPPNAFGLYDMHGNVWEWCEDIYHDSYKGAPADGSAWVTGGNAKYRVMRGCSYMDNAFFSRSSERVRVVPANRMPVDGLRLVAIPRQ
jgi:eukaryotic-like serine/threonine-protein kinase